MKLKKKKIKSPKQKQGLPTIPMTHRQTLKSFAEAAREAQVSSYPIIQNEPLRGSETQRSWMSSANREDQRISGILH